MFDEPAMWLERYLSGALTVTTSMLPTLLVVAMPFIGVAGLLAVKTTPHVLTDHFRSTRLGNLWLPLPVLAVQFVTVTTTGYPDRRYFSVMGATLAMLLFIAFARVMQRMLPAWGLILLALVVPEVASLQQMPGITAQPIRTRVHRPTNDRQHRRIVKCLPDDARVLILDGVGPYPFGALTGIETFTKPNNLTRRNFVPFVRRFGITHVLAKRKRSVHLAQSAGPIKKLCKREPVWTYTHQAND
jgi:hypothetical protein